MVLRNILRDLPRSLNWRLTGIFLALSLACSGRVGFAGIAPPARPGAGDIRGCVPDVVESFVGKAAAQAVELVVSCEIGGAVAGEDSLEDAEVFGDAVRQGGVCSGGEVELAAFGV